MTSPRPLGLQSIAAMSSSRVILGELLSSRARLRFPGQPQAQPSTPVRQEKYSERHTGLFQSVSPKGVTPPPQNPVKPPTLCKSRQPTQPNRLAETK